MAEHSIYTTGGTVQAGGGIYLARQADAELLELCQQGAFVYILTPRQMGKSSLMVRTAAQVSQVGHRAAMIDLTQLGVQVTAEQWYLGFLAIIEEQLELATDVVQWWQARSHLGLTQRMTQFFKEVLLAEVAEPVVIFVDEIDSTLSLDFTDDFFAAIRYLYVARAQEPVFQRLSFVLIGVATPADLIRDPKRTPFNIGQRIDLTDFTLAEARPLIAGLGLPAPAAEQVLGWLLEWTGGHPYLTQRLCGALVERQQEAWTKPEVNRLVAETFLGTMSRQDNNLQFVRDMLTRRAPDVEAVLTTYREAWRSKRVEDEEQSLIKSHLKLSGVVKREDTRLIVRNPIYRRVFDAAWVQEHLPETWWERIKPAMPLITTLLLATLGMAGVTAYAVAQQHEAKRQEGFAQKNAQKFEAKSREFEATSVEAQRLQQEAERQRDNATQEKRKAQQANLKALTALKQAEAARTAETQQRRLAEQQQLAANLARQAETEQRQRAEIGERDAKQQTLLAERQRLAAEAEGLGISALRDFESGSGEIEALLKAIQAGQKLKKLVGSSQVVEAYPAKSSLFALQKILDNIHEQSRFDSDLSKVNSGSNRVNDVSFSPDGQHIAIVRRNGTVEIWDKLGQQIAQWQAHQGWIDYLSFSPNGKHIATMGGDGWVRLWDVTSKQKLAEFSGRRIVFARKDNMEGTVSDDFYNQQRDFESITVSHNTQKIALATVEINGKTQLWDWTGKLITQLKDHRGAIKSVIFSPTGQHIATVENDDSVQIWDALGKPLIKLETVLDVKNREFTRHSVSFSPDEQRIATVGKDQVVRVWNLQGERIAQLKGTFVSVLFTPDGKYLAALPFDKDLGLWNLSSLEQDAEFRPSAGRDGLGVPFNMTFSPDGKRLAVVGHIGRIQILDWAGQQLAWLKVFNQPFVSASTSFRYGLAFSPDWKYLITATSNSQLKLWNLSERQLTQWTAWEVRTPLGFFTTPDRQYVATVTENRVVQLRNLLGKIVAHWDNYQGDVAAVFFNPNDSTVRYIATAGDDGKVKIWDSSGKLIRELNTMRYGSVSFSLDGSQIAVLEGDHTVSLWSVSTDSPNPLAKWETGYPSGTDGFVYSLSHSPNLRYVATAGQSGKAQIFDLTQHQIIQLQGHEGIVANIAFSPDGQHIATAGGDGTARLWDLSGHELNRFLHQDGVNSVSFSPNGQFLATSNSNTVRIWTLSGIQIAEFKGNSSTDGKVTFSPDGKQIGLIGSTVQIWRVEGLDELLVRGCHWVQDYLKYNPNVPESEKHICDAVVQ